MANMSPPCSCSKQHAALQYRLVPFTKSDGSQSKRVQLYVMDLNSANGTFVNNNKIESQKYVQLLEKVNIFTVFFIFILKITQLLGRVKVRVLFKRVRLAS